MVADARQDNFRGYISRGGASSGPANLGDILERVLDRGLVIAGDIRVSLLDIELITIKLRLLVASVDTARQLGIDWWEHDPWLSSRRDDRELTATPGKRESGPGELEAGRDELEEGPDKLKARPGGRKRAQ